MELKPGQLLQVKRQADLSDEDKVLLEKLGIDRQYSHIWVVYVDNSGVSVKVTNTARRRDVEAFFPKGGTGLRNWSTYFELTGATNKGYANGKKHFTAKFPS